MKHLQTFESYDKVNEELFAKLGKLLGFGGKEKKEASQAASATIQAQSDLAPAEAKKATTKAQSTIDKVMEHPKFKAALGEAMTKLQAIPDDKLPDPAELKKAVEAIKQNSGGVDAAEVGEKVAAQAQIKEFYSINEEENMAKKFLTWLFPKFGLAGIGAISMISGVIGSLVSVAIAIIGGGGSMPLIAVVSAGAAIVGLIVALIGLIGGAIGTKLTTGSWPQGFSSR